MKVFEVVERSSGFWVVDGKGVTEGPFSSTHARAVARRLEAKTERGKLIDALRKCVTATDAYVTCMGMPSTSGVTTCGQGAAYALKELAKAQTEARNLLSEVA